MSESDEHSEEPRSAYLVLMAGPYEYLLPVERVARVVELEPGQVAAESEANGPQLGRVALEGRGELPLLALSPLILGECEAALPGELFEAVEVELRGELVLLVPDKVGSIEEHAPGESSPVPRLLWGAGNTPFVRAWPAVFSLRWELELDRIGLHSGGSA